MKSNWLALSFVLFLFGLAHAQEAPVEVANMGGQQIRIPTPEGFSRTDGIIPEYDQLVQGFLPATNRLLVEFGSPEKRRAMLRGTEIPDEERSVNIQVVRQLEPLNFSVKDFAVLKDEFRNPLLAQISKENIDRSLEKGSKNATEKSGETADMKLTDMGQIGILSEDANHLTFGMAIGMDINIADQKQAAKAYVLVTVLRLHGKVLSLYFTAGNTPKDRAWAVGANLLWRQAIEKENAALAEAMKDVPVSDLGF